MAKIVNRTRILLGGVDMSGYIREGAEWQRSFGGEWTANLTWLVKDWSMQNGTSTLHLAGPDITLKPRVPKEIGSILIEGELVKWQNRHVRCKCNVTPILGGGWKITVMDTCPEKEHRI